MDIADQILYEDNHLIALNKLPGQIVQADKTGDTCLADMVKAFLKCRDSKPGNVFCGVIHRLDRPVSGVVIFAKTGKALSRMNELVKSRDFHKSYLAVVKTPPPQPQGHLEDYLLRNEKQNKSYAYAAEKPNSKKAILKYRLIGKSDNYSLLEVQLMTGRHHQIRCQLAAMGCPIKGDLKYGAPRSNPDGSISLLSRRIEFIHPVSKERITVEAPLPDDPLWQVFKQQDYDL